jgi:hypothetical protein
MHSHGVQSKTLSESMDLYLDSIEFQADVNQQIENLKSANSISDQANIFDYLSNLKDHYAEFFKACPAAEVFSDGLQQPLIDFLKSQKVAVLDPSQDNGTNNMINVQIAGGDASVYDFITHMKSNDATWDFGVQAQLSDGGDSINWNTTNDAKCWVDPSQICDLYEDMRDQGYGHWSNGDGTADTHDDGINVIVEHYIHPMRSSNYYYYHCYASAATWAKYANVVPGDGQALNNLMNYVNQI